jgi:hypothetical protein
LKVRTKKKSDSKTVQTKEKQEKVEEKRHMEVRGNLSPSNVLCFVCNSSIDQPKQDENFIEGEPICDSCRNEMFSSLEKAWKKHSAFLDAALN